MFALILVHTAMIMNVHGQSAAGKSQYNVTSNHLAIEGYDPVSYFTDHAAVEGKKDFSYTYDGIVYHFISAQHLQAFKSNPKKYQPQYGGWCAYAMGASGEKVAVDPETFKVLDGKLYLFYNSFFNNTKKSWDKDEANLKHKADINWQKFTH
jgi:YHS domain-containing protein